MESSQHLSLYPVTLSLWRYVLSNTCAISNVMLISVYLDLAFLVYEVSKTLFGVNVSNTQMSKYKDLQKNVIHL